MNITRAQWRNYIDQARKLNEKAAQLMADYLGKHNTLSEDGMLQALEYAYALVTKYGEASAALSCEMYEAIAQMSGKYIAAAVPAETATYHEVAKQVVGTMKQSNNPDKIASSVSRLVKMAGVDTTMQNALRDGAEWAWIPQGDTCPFCLMLASRGWNKASKKAIKGGHAEHIHANCDCTYAIRFDSSTDVDGYDPDGLYDYLQAQDGIGWDDKLNSLRRQHYADNKDVINEQKRIAYKKRKEQGE